MKVQLTHSVLVLALALAGAACTATLVATPVEGPNQFLASGSRGRITVQVLPAHEGQYRVSVLIVEPPGYGRCPPMLRQKPARGSSLRAACDDARGAADRVINPAFPG